MNLDNIFANFFNNQASKEELDQLETWKAESDENIEALNEMEHIWKLTDQMKEYKSFNKSKAFMKVNSKIVDVELAKEPKKSSSILRYLMPMAASLLLITAIVWGVQNFMGGEKRVTEYYSDVTVSDIKLEDHSSLSLDKDASVTLISDFENSREVKVNGRVFFDVSKDKERPFKVHTPQGIVTVLGTQFVVSSNDTETQVLLKEGEVRFDHNGKSIQLLPGNGLRSNAKGLTKFSFSPTNIDSWRTNTLSFENTQVNQLFNSLSQHFDLKLELSNHSIQTDCSLSSTFRNLSIEEILNEIKLIFDIKYTLKDGRLVIHSLSC